MPQFKLVKQIPKIRWDCTLICMVLKSSTEWSRAQHVSTPTTMILTTTMGPFNGLNFFSNRIRTSQISTYQNSAKLLTHPCTYIRYQLQASYVSSHTEELWYNETVCQWMTIYTLPHGGWALWLRNFRLPLA